MSATLYHVMHCKPCQIVIWSRIINTALRRAREAPVPPSTEQVRRVTGSR